MRDANSSHRGPRCVGGGGTKGSGVAAMLGAVPSQHGLCGGLQLPGRPVLGAVSPHTSQLSPAWWAGRWAPPAGLPGQQEGIRPWLALPAHPAGTHSSLGVATPPDTAPGLWCSRGAQHLNGHKGPQVWRRWAGAQGPVQVPEGGPLTCPGTHLPGLCQPVGRGQWSALRLPFRGPSPEGRQGLR